MFLEMDERVLVHHFDLLFFFCCPGAYGFADWLPAAFLA